MRAIQQIVALILCAAMISQTIARLVWGLSQNLVSPSGAVLHLATVAAIIGIGFWFVTLPSKKMAMLTATLWFGIVHTLFFLMDFGLFAAPRFAGVPLTFPFIIDVGCGGNLEWGCVTNYSAVAIAFGALFLLFIGLYAVAIGQVRRIAMRIVSTAPRFRFRHVGLLWAAIVAIANLAFWEQWSNRDPLHALFLKEYIKGPPGLSTNARAVPDRRPVPVNNVVARPLVLIVVDAMRSDVAVPGSVFAESMPFLHGLQSSGKLVSYGPAITTCTMSFCGITSLLSSRYWAQLDRPPLTISDELARYGYQSHYLLSGNHRRFFNMRTIYGPNVSTFVDEQDGTSGQTANDRDLLPHLRSLKFHDPNRSFIYMHLMGAHAVGWKEGIGDDVQALAMAALTGRNDEKTRAAYRRQYMAGLRQADQLIEAMFAELGRRQLLNRALVIIVADHGERLGENGRFGHGGAPDSQVALVPLLVFDPLKAAYANRRIVSTVDVAPTFLEAIRAPVPKSWSGIALQRDTINRAVAIDSEDVEAFVADHGKYLYLHLCQIATGEQTALALQAHDDQQARRLSPSVSGQMRRLGATLPSRSDRGSCRAPCAKDSPHSVCKHPA